MLEILTIWMHVSLYFVVFYYLKKQKNKKKGSHYVSANSAAV